MTARWLIFLFLLLFSPAVAKAVTVHIILEGDTSQVSVMAMFVNGSIVFINKSTTISSQYKILIEVMSLNSGYYFTVNGTKYYYEYAQMFYNDTTLIINVSPDYITLNVNLRGGNITLVFSNGTAVELSHSASFRVLNNTQIEIYSPNSNYLIVNGEKTLYYFATLTNETNNISVEVLNETVLGNFTSILKSPTTSASSTHTQSALSPYLVLGILAIVIGLAVLFVRRK